jgi:hypothetical protein
MKVAMALVLLWGLLAGQSVGAEQVKISHPHWVIISTIIDLTTGRPLDERGRT